MTQRCRLLGQLSSIIAALLKQAGVMSELPVIALAICNYMV